MPRVERRGEIFCLGKDSYVVQGFHRLYSDKFGDKIGHAWLFGEVLLFSTTDFLFLWIVCLMVLWLA